MIKNTIHILYPCMRRTYNTSKKYWNLGTCFTSWLPAGMAKSRCFAHWQPKSQTPGSNHAILSCWKMFLLISRIGCTTAGFGVANVESQIEGRTTFYNECIRRPITYCTVLSHWCDQALLICLKNIDCLTVKLNIGKYKTWIEFEL